MLGLRRLTSAITLEPGRAEVRHRVARRRGVGEAGSQLGQRERGLAAGEVLAYSRDDVVEDGTGRWHALSLSPGPSPSGAGAQWTDVAVAGSGLSARRS